MRVNYTPRVAATQAIARPAVPYGVQRSDEADGVLREMRRNRRATAALARKTAVGGGAGGSASGGFSDIQFATGRPRDPLFYWRQNNLPYDFSQNEELAKVRAFCRLLYQTDPIVGSCVDIFSKFPTIGHTLECKDQRLGEFYEDQFFNEDKLDYEEFLVDIGREYYIAGEAWPFATFNEDLGIWDNEELLNPDDIKAERSPFLKDPRYFIKLPWTIRQILQTRQPVWEYQKLIQEYPELAAYTSENAFMPVSNVLLRQLKFKGDTFNIRGIPLLTRAMRSMLQQEMLNSALDSIADRLYTPLLLAKLGASASDLGTSVPWIPTDDDLENFELALDAALAGDFRVLIHNFAIELEQVFGKENMPDLTPDFERIEDRVLQVFGLSRTFLMGAGEGETYAADALNKELVTQLMTRYQKYLQQHFRSRALIVAEAQEHYDYEERAGRRFVIMEEVLEVDEESGERRIVEQPKLLVPDLKFKTLNFKDEDVVRQFTEALRASGVPISQRTRTRGLDLDMDEEIEKSQDEAVQAVVAEQETRKRSFIALRDAGLPIPDDLMQDFAPMAQIDGLPPGPAAEAIMAPRIGVDPLSTPNLAPTPDDAEMEDEAEQSGEDPMDGSMEEEAETDGAPPGGDEPQRPEESDEERGGMPKAGQLWRRTARVRRQVEAAAFEDESIRVTAGKAPRPQPEEFEEFEFAKHAELTGVDKDGKPQTTEWESGPVPSCYDTPRHVGIRRHLGVRAGDEELAGAGKYS